MKKLMKKLLAVVAAMTMVLAMAIPAMAATITINPGNATGTETNTTYTGYKIFDATKTSDGSGVAYSVASNSPWLSALQAQGQTWVTLTASADGTTYTVTKNNTLTDTSAADFAVYLNSNIPSAATSVSFTKQDDGSYKTTTVDEGYYLIKSSLGTELILDTTQEDEINEKNDYPGDNKEAETASVSIGDSATFYITVTVPVNVDTTKPITVHDQLPEQLSFNDDVKYYIATTPTTAWTLDQKKAFTYSDLPDEGITVATENLDDEDDSFTITIDTAKNSVAGKTIVFKYTAELLSSADADGDGYTNTEYIDYSDYTSNEKTTKTKTYDINVNKTNSSGTALTGAEFELRTDASDANTAIKFITKTGGYKKADTDDQGTTTTLEAGSINIEGLGAGTYYLVETAAPEGYNKLQSAITVSITDDGVITFTAGEGNTGTAIDSTQTDRVNVVNQSGTELPSTGGMGTTIFYILGAILVIGAGVVLVTRRRTV